MESKLKNRIWLLCEKIRGPIDSWDFKQYIFTLLFWKYTSEEFAQEINNYERQFGEFDYATLSDEESLEIKEESLQDYGLFYKPSELFSSLILCENGLHLKLHELFTNLNETLRDSKLSNIFSEVNFLSTRLGTTDEDKHLRIKKIMEMIEEIYAMNIESLFSDLFEFLMHMYATDGGSAGGEFFTPPQVSDLLSSLITTKQVESVYDPTCGTGSLLKKVNARKYYGEEINPLSASICKMNLFADGLHVDSFDIRCTDTLKHPQFLDLKFDVIVSNPPYSVHYDRKLLEKDQRVSQIGVAPPMSKGDWMFIAHCLHQIKDDGVIGAVIFPGILYRDQKELEIRKNLIEKNYIDTIILLPEQMFFKTSTSTCILILKKRRQSSSVLFIDSNAYVEKVGALNFLTEIGAKTLQTIYQERREVDKIARLVNKEEIVANNYNLCVKKYIKQEKKVKYYNLEEIENKLKELKEDILKIESEL